MAVYCPWLRRFCNRRRRKLFTVLQRAEREVLAKMVAQGAGAGKPAALSDLIDAHRALRQVLAGAQQSFLQQPAGGRFTGGLLKAAQKVRVPMPARWAREATVWLAARCWCR
nr:Uncharacterised protein [Klebsiella pneumoniae]